MKKSKASDIAILAIFIAIMVVVQVLSQIVYSVWPLPIVPTLLHIPVIIGSIVLGARKGAFLGLVMGIISVINSTILTTPLSYVFSPLQPIPGTNHGSLWALVVAIVPRILIGVFPYFIYNNSVCPILLFGKDKFLAVSNLEPLIIVAYLLSEYIIGR